MNRKSTRHTTFFSVISIFMMILSLITPTQIHALDTFVDMTYDETSPLSNKVAIVNGAIWTRIDVNDPDNTAAGTGVFDAFLQIQKNGEEKGYNSDLASPYFDAKKANTHSMLLKDVPIIAVDGGLYYEFHMDINENDRFLVTNRLQIWTTDVKSLTNTVFDAASGGLSFPDHEVFKAYDTEGSIIMLYYHNGSGKPEYKVWVPVSNFVQKTYVVLYAYHGADNPAIPETYRVGNSYDASDGFEEWGIKIYPEIPPSLVVTKTALTLEVNEPGEFVTYKVDLTNTSSPVDTLTITTLTDAIEGGTPFDISGMIFDDSALLMPTVFPFDIAPNMTKTVYFKAEVRGEPRDVRNIVYARGYDEENTMAEDDDDAIVKINDVLPTILLNKTADPKSMLEPGGTFNFEFVITNTSVEDIWLTKVEDDILGVLYQWEEGMTKIWIGAGAAYTLPGAYSKLYTEAGVYPNVAVAYAEDNEMNKTSATDRDSVEVIDVKPTMRIEKTAAPLSMDEPGGTFTYTFKIFNTSVEPLWLTEVVDDVLGTLYKWTSGDKIWIAAGGSYDLPGSFTKMYTDAGSYKNIVMAYGEDNEGNKTNATDDATVVVNDVLPTIEVTKTANRTSIPYTGVMVDFTFVIYNRSVEKVIVTSIMDDVFGNLFPEAFEQNMYEPIIIDVAGSYTFTVSRMISGTAGGSHVNVVTVEAQDNEGNTATDWDDETITFYWMGFTPGYWKNHLSDWVKTAYTPIMLVTDVFNITHPNVLTKGILDLDGNKKPDTLLDALNYKGGGNIKGKVQILMRAAVAALLNESALGDMFPPYDTVEDLIKHVEDTVNSGDIQAIGALATLLDAYNNGEHIFYPY